LTQDENSILMKTLRILGILNNAMNFLKCFSYYNVTPYYTLSIRKSHDAIPLRVHLI